jgi:hypothetical protein
MYIFSLGPLKLRSENSAIKQRSTFSKLKYCILLHMFSEFRWIMTKTQKSNKALPPSPKKAKHAPNMKDKLKTKKEKPIPTIHAQGFKDPLAVEV